MLGPELPRLQVQKVACPRFSLGSYRLGSVPEVWTEPVQPEVLRRFRFPGDSVPKVPKITLCALKVCFCTLQVIFCTLKVYFCTLKVCSCTLNYNLVLGKNTCVR